MTGLRKRFQKEKLDFQKELTSYDKDFIDQEIEEEKEYDLLYGWKYDEWDYNDDWNNDYIDDYYDDLWWYEDNDYEPSYKPGNHIEDKKTGDIYIVTEDYRLVNIMTGEYKAFIQDYEVVL